MNVNRLESMNFGTWLHCPMCGKKFFVFSISLANWSYKRKGKPLCSYRCYRKSIKGCKPFKEVLDDQIGEL